MRLCFYLALPFVSLSWRFLCFASLSCWAMRLSSSVDPLRHRSEVWGRVLLDWLPLGGGYSHFFPSDLPPFFFPQIPSDLREVSLPLSPPCRPENQHKTPRIFWHEPMVTSKVHRRLPSPPFFFPPSPHDSKISGPHNQKTGPKQKLCLTPPKTLLDHFFLYNSSFSKTLKKTLCTQFPPLSLASGRVSLFLSR